MANEKDLLQNTGMNEAKEDGNRAEKSQESEGKILHNVNDIMDQLMAYGDAVNDAAFSELLEKLPEEDTKKTFAPGEPKNSMMALGSPGAKGVSSGILLIISANACVFIASAA